MEITTPKYDSILYGNGMTIAIMNHLKKKGLLQDEYSFNNFIIKYFTQKNQELDVEFRKYFKLDARTKRQHFKAKIGIVPYIKEIKKIGFERTVSKNLFNKSAFKSNEIMYLYLLHNYWYNLINNKIHKDDNIKNELINISHKIRKLINIKGNIFTINFDTFLDEYLNPKHLHGRFCIPLVNSDDMLLKIYDDNSLEYTYLFGGNGLEKMNRLNKINKFEQSYYDLQFFYNSDLNLKKILIFGVSFGDSGILSEDFLIQYPKYDNLFLVRSIDGHLLLKLEIMYQKDQLEKVTIAYYSDEDLILYKEILKMTKIKDIAEYIHTSDILGL